MHSQAHLRPLPTNARLQHVVSGTRWQVVPHRWSKGRAAVVELANRWCREDRDLPAHHVAARMPEQVMSSIPKAPLGQPTLTPGRLCPITLRLWLAYVETPAERHDQHNLWWKRFAGFPSWVPRVTPMPTGDSIASTRRRSPRRCFVRWTIF